jgi:hypothetical protein
MCRRTSVFDYLDVIQNCYTDVIQTVPCKILLKCSPVGRCPLLAFGVLYLLGDSSYVDRLGGLVVRVLGFRSGGSGSIPGTTRKKRVVGLERGPLSLVSTTEELLDRKAAAPV